MTRHEKLDIAIKILGVLGALIAFGVGLRQYERAQSWQRADTVLALIDTFESDPQIAVAREILDMDQVHIRVPIEQDSTTPPVGTDESPNTEKFKFDNSMLVDTLRVTEMDLVCDIDTIRSDTPCWTPAQYLVRQSLDRFFDFFDRVYGLRKAGLIKRRDIAYFHYWLELVRDAGVYKHDSATQTALDTYIDSYNFRGIRYLVDEYAEDPDPLLTTVSESDATVDTTQP